MQTIPHPENLTIGKRYRFTIDIYGRMDWEEGELDEIYWEHPIRLKVKIADDVWSEFCFEIVVGVEEVK